MRLSLNDPCADCFWAQEEQSLFNLLLYYWRVGLLTLAIFFQSLIIPIIRDIDQQQFRWFVAKKEEEKEDPISIVESFAQEKVRHNSSHRLDKKGSVRPREENQQQQQQQSYQRKQSQKQLKTAQQRSQWIELTDRIERKLRTRLSTPIPHIYIHICININY